MFFFVSFAQVTTIQRTNEKFAAAPAFKKSVYKTTYDKPVRNSDEPNSREKRYSYNAFSTCVLMISNKNLRMLHSSTRRYRARIIAMHDKARVFALSCTTLLCVVVLSATTDAEDSALSSPMERKMRYGFFEVARENAVEKRDRTKLYFYHVHKGGGTFMLHNAAAQGLVTIQWTVSKNRRLERVYHSAVLPRHTRHVDFVSNEHFLVDSERMPWDAYRGFVTTIRDPVCRAWSHFRHVSDIYHYGYGEDAFIDWVTRRPDNYYTRRFCGYPCEEVPRGKLTRRHLNAALDNLYRFDVVVDMEGYYHEGLLVMAALYEWDASKLLTSAERATYPKRSRSELSQRAVDAVLSMATLDMEFYWHAKLIAHSLVNEYRARRVANTSQRCTNACCGACSKW